MRKGQGSAEYLVLLGVALLIGLVVVGVLAFYPGTSEESRKAESDIYWRSAKPIAVTEAIGVSRLGVESYVDGIMLRVKSLELQDRITIKGVSFGGYADKLYFGSGFSTDAYGHYIVQEGTCSAAANAAQNCSIPLSPGRELFVQMSMETVPARFCATGGGINSQVKSYEGDFKIYYEHSGIIRVQSGSYKLRLTCFDYWVCSTSAQCTARYGAVYGALCSNGACLGGGP